MHCTSLAGKVDRSSRRAKQGRMAAQLLKRLGMGMSGVAGAPGSRLAFQVGQANAHGMSCRKPSMGLGWRMCQAVGDLQVGQVHMAVQAL